MKKLIGAVILALCVGGSAASVAAAASPSPSPNHGDTVSTIAKAWDHLNGRAHGAAVSAAARAHGAAVSAAAKAKHQNKGHGKPDASASAGASTSTGNGTGEPGQIRAHHPTGS
jgi:hypothetical protein